MKTFIIKHKELAVITSSILAWALTFYLASTFYPDDIKAIILFGVLGCLHYVVGVLNTTVKLSNDNL